MTKQYRKEHRIVFMFDMTLFSEFCAQKCAQSTEKFFFVPQSYKTNLGIFFVFHIYRFFYNFDRNVLETSGQVQNNRN